MTQLASQAAQPNTLSLRGELLSLIEAAIAGDLLNEDRCGFVTVMARSKPHIRQDIPAAFEMYTLLTHYLGTLPLHAVTLGCSEVPLAPGILFDVPSGRLLVLIPVDAHQMEDIAYWVASGVRSPAVKAMAGLLALPFSIEAREETRHLIPEWFAAFYVGGSADHCVPVLALRSIVLDPRFADWVAVALERMPVFGLPCARADQALRPRDPR
jgi:hypothetical protein